MRLRAGTGGWVNGKTKDGLTKAWGWQFRSASLGGRHHHGAFHGHAAPPLRTSQFDLFDHDPDDGGYQEVRHGRHGCMDGWGWSAMAHHERAA